MRVGLPRGCWDIPYDRAEPIVWDCSAKKPVVQLLRQPADARGIGRPGRLVLIGRVPDDTLATSPGVLRYYFPPIELIDADLLLRGQVGAPPAPYGGQFTTSSSFLSLLSALALATKFS